MKHHTIIPWLSCFLMTGFIFVISYPFTYAQDTPSLSALVTKKLTVEHAYIFYVMAYEPPVGVLVFENVPAKTEDLRNPEKVAISYLSAQAQGNNDWFESLISGALRQSLNEQLTSSKKTMSDFISERSKMFQGGKVELTHRIERERYSIIHYRIVSIKDGTIMEEGDIAIGTSSEQGRMLDVKDLKSDPVYENWKFEGATKIIRIKVF